MQSELQHTFTMMRDTSDLKGDVLNDGIVQALRKSLKCARGYSRRAASEVAVTPIMPWTAHHQISVFPTTYIYASITVSNAHVIHSVVRFLKCCRTMLLTVPMSERMGIERDGCVEGAIFVLSPTNLDWIEYLSKPALQTTGTRGRKGPPAHVGSDHLRDVTMRADFKGYGRWRVRAPAYLNEISILSKMRHASERPYVFVFLRAMCAGAAAAGRVHDPLPALPNGRRADDVSREAAGREGAARASHVLATGRRQVSHFPRDPASVP